MEAGERIHHFPLSAANDWKTLPAEKTSEKPSLRRGVMPKTNGGEG